MVDSEQECCLTLGCMQHLALHLGLLHSEVLLSRVTRHMDASNRLDGIPVSRPRCSAVIPGKGFLKNIYIIKKQHICTPEAVKRDETIQ